MPEFLFSNFGQSALSAPLGPVETEMKVSPSDALRFPQPGQDQVFTLILMDGRNEPEIVWVVDNPLTGILAVERGREGTPAIGWETGTIALHSHTAASLEWFVTGGQILWKNQFQAMLDAAIARIAALEAKDTEIVENQFEYNNYLESRIEQSFATISENWQVVTDFNYAMAQVTQTLTADVASNHAELVEFKEVTAGSFGAQAVYNLDLTAKTNNAVATANQSLQATVDLDSALSTAKTTLTAQFGLNSGQITNLQTADVNNYEALSTAINTVAANYGPLSATVTVKSIALADLTGAVGGAFSVDINTSTGAFAGFRIVAGEQAGTIISEAKFEVNRFIIAAPGGGSAVNPFIYDAVNGWLEVQNLRVRGQLLVDGTVHGKDKAVKDTFTYGTTMEVSPNVVFGPGPDSPGGGSWTDIWNANFNANGGRVKLSFQCVLGNADTVKTLDARVNVLVDGVLVRYFAGKLGTDYGSTVTFSASVYVTPGIHNVAVQAGTKFSTNGGTANGTFMSIILDIDDYNTES